MTAPTVSGSRRCRVALLATTHARVDQPFATDLWRSRLCWRSVNSHDESRPEQRTRCRGALATFEYRRRGKGGLLAPVTPVWGLQVRS